MNRIYSVFLLVFLCPLAIQGSNDPKGMGARSAGLAHATVMLTDFWSVFQNQAGLAYLQGMAVGFHHSSGFVRETDHQAMALIIPSSTGTVASTFSYYGYAQYHETELGLAYGRYIAKKLATGIKIDYFSTRIAGTYGRADVLTFEAGLIWQLHDRLSMGAHVFNPVRMEIGQTEEKMPTVLRMGFVYHFTEALCLCAEAEKDMDNQVLPKVGMEYELVDHFFMRAGISLHPVMNYFGLGYSWKCFQADVAFSYHQVLGYLPQFSLRYEF